MNDEFGKRTVFSGAFQAPAPEFEAPWGEGQRPQPTRRAEISIPGMPKGTVVPLDQDVLMVPTHETISAASDLPPAPRDQL